MHVGIVVRTHCDIRHGSPAIALGFDFCYMCVIDRHNIGAYKTHTVSLTSCSRALNLVRFGLVLIVCPNCGAFCVRSRVLPTTLHLVVSSTLSLPDYRLGRGGAASQEGQEVLRHCPRPHSRHRAR